QPIGCDPPRMNIFPELLNIHATLIADFPKSGSASFQGMDGYVESDYGCSSPDVFRCECGLGEIFEETTYG
ncbi:MAG: hypothetical protein WCB27_18475, partial [Thermoguttaceae bacterium]